MARRVVVTGLGMVSPLGTGVENNWKAACSGESGIGPVTRFDATDSASKIAGEVKGFNAADFLEKQMIRRFDVFYSLCYCRRQDGHGGFRTQN